MSRLFHVEPCGVGTSAIEAFPSFVIRTATEHSVTPARLLQHVLSAEGDDAERACQLIMRSDIAVLCRPNDTTSMIQSALAAALGLPPDGVRSTTFMGLLPGLARPLNTFSSSLRWCPACFAESSRRGESVYYRLLWQLRPVHSCDVHRVKLRTRCSSCGASQGGFGRIADLSRCKRCRGDLGKLSSADRSAAFADPEYVSLVGFIASHPSVWIPKGGLASVVRRLFNDAWASEAERALYRRIPRDQCLRFANPDEPVTLPAARRIAGQLGVPLVDLLLGRVEGCSRPIPFSEPGGGRNNPQGDSPRRIPDPSDMKRRFAKLLRAAQARGAPLSLREAAGELGISVGGLQYRFPALCRALSESRRNALAAARMVRDERIAAAVSEAVTDAALSADQPPGRKALLRRLRHETGLPKHRLRLAIRQEIAALSGSDADRVANRLIRNPSTPAGDRS